MNFNIRCPFCKRDIIDYDKIYLDDECTKELLKDGYSQFANINCPHCEKPIVISCFIEIIVNRDE